MRGRVYRYAALACIAFVSIAGCKKESVRAPAQTTKYVFEPPVPVLQRLGIERSSSPRLGERASGEIYLPAVYGKKNQLGFFMSHNGGDTFLGPIPISGSKASVQTHGEASPTLAFSHTVIYALWQQRSPHGSDLMVSRSLNWGHSFEKPVAVAVKDKPSFNGFASIGVAPNGDVYVVWLDGRDKQPPVPNSLDPEDTFSVYVARSTDHGASFGGNIRVAYGACPCCRPALAFGPHGEVFVAWRKVFSGDIRDVVVANSQDRGRTFSTPVRIAADRWKLTGCPDSGPALAVRGNRLYAAWMTESDSKPRIKLSYSDDGAQTFTKPIVVSGDVLYPNHPSLAIADDGTVLVAFQGRDPATDKGWGNLVPYLAVVNKSGAARPMEVPGNRGSALYPQVQVGGAGRVCVAWTETTDSGSRVVLSRGRRISP